MDSGVSDLLRQIPIGIVLMFVISAILLVIVVGYVFRARARRAQARAPAMGGGGIMAANDFSDLPDLDTLASGETSRAAPRPPKPSGAYSIQLAEGETVEAVEVFSVLRDVGEGGLIIRIGDKAYRNPPALADADFKRRFQGALRDLSSVQQPVDSASEPVSVTSDAPLEMPPDEPLIDIPRVSAYMPVPGDLPKFKMPDGPPVKPKRGQRPVAEPIPEINIAASIEAFLQHKLTMMPQYSRRSIHVRPAAQGGVQIEVDGLFYESVSEVEDVAVRQYLTSTIAEWQARQ